MGDYQRLFAADLVYLLPELTLIVTAVVMSLIDLFLPDKQSRRSMGLLGLIGIAVSVFFIVQQVNVHPLDPATNQPVTKVLLGQMYRLDDFAHMFKLIFLTGTALVILLGMGTFGRNGQSKMRHEGEFYYLLLAASVGAMVMASSGDLITLFIGLELLSITSYILVGMYKSELPSNEASFKYIVMGGISSAFIIYGMSFLYGLTGTTNIAVLSQGLPAVYSSFEPIIYLSFFLMIAGFGFKIAAVPFHTWAPDVYQGAPTPVTAFLAVVSKAAALAIIFRLFINVYAYLQPNPMLGVESSFFDDALLTFSVLAAASMIIGNTVALRQTNVKRLLAWSGIANAGYLLSPVFPLATRRESTCLPRSSALCNRAQRSLSIHRCPLLC